MCGNRDVRRNLLRELGRRLGGAAQERRRRRRGVPTWRGHVSVYLCGWMAILSDAVDDTDSRVSMDGISNLADGAYCACDI